MATSGIRKSRSQAGQRRQASGRNHRRNTSQTKLLTAYEVADRFALSYQTVNYYTNIGLLHWSKREGNRRLYEPGSVKKRLQQVQTLKDRGFPLKLIQQLIDDD